MIVYCATNKINGKKYIGQSTKTLEERIRDHRHDAKHQVTRPFMRALNKYGIEGFDWEVLCECSSTQEMIDKEIELIEKHGSFGHKGYNAHKGGQYRTEEIKAKTSKSVTKFLMGHKHSEETKRKISEARMGYKRSAESKIKQSLHNARVAPWKGKKLSEEHKKAIANGGLGKKKPGTSLAMKKKWQDYRLRNKKLEALEEEIKECTHNF